MSYKVTAIESDNIVYLPITEEDTDMVLKWRNCAAVKANFIYQNNITREEHLNWIRNKVNTGKVMQFVMLEKKSGKPFGSVYLKDVNYEVKKAEFGIFIGEDGFRGIKYGSEATRKMVEFCIGDMGFHKVYLRVLKRNEAAYRAYINAGFKPEGEMVDEEYINGKYETVVFMAAFE